MDLDVAPLAMLVGEVEEQEAAPLNETQRDITWQGTCGHDGGRGQQVSRSVVCPHCPTGEAKEKSQHESSRYWKLSQPSPL